MQAAFSDLKQRHHATETLVVEVYKHLTEAAHHGDLFALKSLASDFSSGTLGPKDPTSALAYTLVLQELVKDPWLFNLTVQLKNAKENTMQPEQINAAQEIKERVLEQIRHNGTIVPFSF